MEEYFLRLWNDFGARVSGPMSFRLFMQPTMALIFAIRDGVKDAKTGRTPYFYSVFTDPDHRKQRLSEGWRAVVKIFTLAVILDALFQIIVFKWIYPVELILVPLVLAFLPYLLARGPVNRIARMIRKAPASFLILLMICTSAYAQQLRDTFRRVKSSVVIVRTGGDQSSPITSQMDDSGVGSGVLISKDGQILTAAHVVSSGLPITIEFTDGQRFKAQVVESNVAADLALLKVDKVPAAAAAAALGDSDVVETGDDIFIVGAPYGLSNTLTVGRISARRPDETRGGILSTSEFLQTDAVVNPGNSGSPVFNKAGEVIAIVSNVVSDTGEFQGVGFAATVNTARTLLLDRDPFLNGLEGVLVTGIVAKALNVPQQAGFLVTNVARDSLAEQMGLVGGQVEAVIDNESLLIGGDVILKINSSTITIDRHTYRTIFSNIARSNAGSLVHCSVLRAGKVVELSVKIPASLSTSRAPRP